MMNVQSNATSTTPRAFARITAAEVSRETQENEEGLFLSVTTPPNHPEPEFGLLG
jgi:hypothetical protein